MHMKVTPKALYSQTCSPGTQEGIYTCSHPLSVAHHHPTCYLSSSSTDRNASPSRFNPWTLSPSKISISLLFSSPLPSDTPVAVLSTPVLCECGIMRLRMELWWSDAGLNWSGRCAWPQPVILAQGYDSRVGLRALIRDLVGGRMSI